MYQYPDGYKTPFAVKEDELIFPMLILFPEHTQSNIVQGVAESDTFADILYVFSSLSLASPLDHPSFCAGTPGVHALGRREAVHRQQRGGLVPGIPRAAVSQRRRRERRFPATALPETGQSGERASCRGTSEPTGISQFRKFCGIRIM